MADIEAQKIAAAKASGLLANMYDPKSPAYIKNALDKTSQTALDEAKAALENVKTGLDNATLDLKAVFTFHEKLDVAKDYLDGEIKKSDTAIAASSKKLKQMEDAREERESKQRQPSSRNGRRPTQQPVRESQPTPQENAEKKARDKLIDERNGKKELVGNIQQLVSTMTTAQMGDMKTYKPESDYEKQDYAIALLDIALTDPRYEAALKVAGIKDAIKVARDDCDDGVKFRDSFKSDIDYAMSAVKASNKNATADAEKESLKALQGMLGLINKKVIGGPDISPQKLPETTPGVEQSGKTVDEETKTVIDTVSALVQFKIRHISFIKDHAEVGVSLQAVRDAAMEITHDYPAGVDEKQKAEIHKTRVNALHDALDKMTTKLEGISKPDTDKVLAEQMIGDLGNIRENMTKVDSLKKISLAPQHNEFAALLESAGFKPIVPLLMDGGSSYLAVAKPSGSKTNQL